MKKNNQSRPLAIFDIDGTIFRSSLLIELVSQFIKDGVLPASANKLYVKQYEAWLDRSGNYDDYINAVISVFNKYIKGLKYSDFERASKEVVHIHQNRVYKYTRDLIKKLKKGGYYLLAVSQSPKGTLDVFCKKLGFNKVYGRFYELGPDDMFTGEVTDVHLITNKANIVKRVLEKENLSLENSIGVGDTEGDISFLEMVENPICFNPNAKLYRIAKINKWKVVIERKDVIYEIKI